MVSVHSFPVFRDLFPIPGVVADEGAIQYRLLNSSRGPAVHGPRAQMDRTSYMKEMQRQLLEETPNLTICTAAVEDLILDKTNNSVVAVSLGAEALFQVGCSAVVLTTGTFLRGIIHMGKTQVRGRGVRILFWVKIQNLGKKLFFE